MSTCEGFSHYELFGAFWCFVFSCVHHHKNGGHHWPLQSVKESDNLWNCHIHNNAKRCIVLSLSRNEVKLFCPPRGNVIGPGKYRCLINFVNLLTKSTNFICNFCSYLCRKRRGFSALPVITRYPFWGSWIGPTHVITSSNLKYLYLLMEMKW